MDASPREQPRGARVSAAPIPPQVLNTEDTEHALSQTQHRQQHTRSCHVLPKPTIQNLKQRPSRLSPVPRAAARAWAARRRRCDSPKRTKKSNSNSSSKKKNTDHFLPSPTLSSFGKPVNFGGGDPATRARKQRRRQRRRQRPGTGRGPAGTGEGSSTGPPRREERRTASNGMDGQESAPRSSA